MTADALKLNDVRAGDTLVADGGFTCLREGDRRVVKAAPNGRLFIECDASRHDLVGQLDHDGALVGLSKDK